MDKKLVLAVAGAGKTTYIIDYVCKSKMRTLIITYTDANYENIMQKLREKNGGVVPENTRVYTYFSFLYTFCYKPFLADDVNAKGICYEPNLNRYAKSSQMDYYMDSLGRLYSNRISFLLEKKGVIPDIRTRIEKYFDFFVVDEVQDISGRDFDFLESLLETSVNILCVGDFYQHTYNTSADGRVNTSLFNDITSYKNRFEKKGLVINEKLLINSWRCGEQACEFVREKLGVEIYSNNDITGVIKYVNEDEEIKDIWDNSQIVKLHYQKAADYGKYHKNWGETKGEDCYQDVCILLNKTTMQAYRKQTLAQLALSTRNKLYVAITRAHGSVYFIDEAKVKEK